MLGSVLFSYSAYLFVFYTYFIREQKEITGVYNIYFVSSTIASLLMSVGLFMMRARIKELQELKVVRKELQMVFGN
jgi:ABC-type transport system involved in cytochrome c biogenesis permease subunit